MNFFIRNIVLFSTKRSLQQNGPNGSTMRVVSLRGILAISARMTSRRMTSTRMTWELVRAGEPESTGCWWWQHHHSESSDRVLRQCNLVSFPFATSSWLFLQQILLNKIWSSRVSLVDWLSVRPAKTQRAAFIAPNKWWIVFINYY